MPNVFPSFVGPQSAPAVSVMSDPRICRGSIAARRREEAARRLEEERQRKAEQRFHTELIRNRLQMIIMPGATGDTSKQASQHQNQQILALNRIECARARDGALGGERRHSIARLAGPLRRRYEPQFQRNAHDALKFHQPIDQAQVPKISLDRAPFPRLPVINARNAANRQQITIPLKDDFKNVQFLPSGEQQNDQGSMATVMPILPAVRESSIPQLPPLSMSAPKSQMSAPKRKQGTSSLGFRRRNITWSDIQSPLDPPPSATGPPAYADTSVQTEEEKAFEDTFAPLITSMVSGAISDAVRNLIEEEQIALIEERERKLMEAIERQNDKNTELNKVVEQQIELQKELEEQKAAALRQLKALESRRMAADELEGVTVKSVEELLSRNMIQKECGQRSVAADTRHFEKQIAHSKRIVAQVRTDFFPYVYARAERVFVERLAGTYLKDALFARDGKRRDDAQNLLNAQIFKYNQLIDASKVLMPAKYEFLN